jgi:hypothetical protein
MKYENQQIIIDNLINGNRSDFKRQIKALSKIEILDLIEYYSGHLGERHIIIYAMRSVLRG